MRHDAARDRWTILAPERVFTPDAIAVAVLQLCDGSPQRRCHRGGAGADLQRAEGARSWPTSCRCCRTSPTRAWWWREHVRQHRRAAEACAPGARRPAGGADAPLPAAMPLLLQSAGAGARRRRAADRGLARRAGAGRRSRRPAAASLRRRADRAAAISSRSSRRRPRSGSTPTSSPPPCCSTRERLERLAGARPRSRADLDPGREPGNADRIAHYRGRPRQEARGRRAGCARSACRSPSTRPSIARTSTSLPAIIELAVDLGAQRLEVAHVQYYGWALQNRQALMPTREQVLRSAELVDAARERLKGVLVIDFVVPDYYASRPKPCMGGWGRGIINITPSGKVLPCHAAETIPGLVFDNVRERPPARHLAQFRCLPEVPRHGLDAGALPLLRVPRGRLGRLPLPGLRVCRRCRPSPIRPARSPPCTRRLPRSPSASPRCRRRRSCSANRERRCAFNRRPLNAANLGSCANYCG